MFAQMMNDISRGKNDSTSGTATAPTKSMAKQILGNSGLVQICESWVQLNNTDRIVNHPSFSKFLNNLMTMTGCTCDHWDEDHCPFHESQTTISDFIWALSHALVVDQTIPVAVPLLATSAFLQCESECDAYSKRKAAAAESGETFKEQAGSGFCFCLLNFADKQIAVGISAAFHYKYNITDCNIYN